MGKSSKLQSRKAAQAEKAAELEKILKTSKVLYKDPAKKLDSLCKGDIKYYMTPQNSGARQIATIFQETWRNNQDKTKRHRFQELLQKLAVGKTSAMLSDGEIVLGLCCVSEFMGMAIRSIEDFEPTSHNRHKQFSQLIRHLFALYEVPDFMDKAFYRQNNLHIGWFIHIAQGKNIRTAAKLPIKLTSKMAHYFTQTPAYYTIEEALRYAQVLGMGGDEYLLGHILATRLGRGFVNEDFWETVIHWFIQNPMLDPTYVQPIVDYIDFQKFNPNEVANNRLGGRMLQLRNPPQPNFSMKGRTPRALLRLVEEWHNELNQIRKEEATLPWLGVAIPDFEYVENEKTIYQTTYHIRQLFTAESLRQEGQAMRHCVASYVHSCRNGNCSIWSMTIEDGFGKKERLLTIELNRERTIVQARGVCNAMPKPRDMNILSRWANRYNLNISRWIKA
ncbi:MAG: PcfJ domain-containing protein [Microscillaceae bacterium]|jgi:hypothetical protein|nr:PcfJ domain-containing protein [Microscillaceae bacterium]